MTTGPLDRWRFVFVLTYARSGSTLIQSLLNAAPGVLIRGENNNALYHMHRAVAGLDAAKTQHGKRATAPDTPWFGAELLTPRKTRTRLLRSFVDTVLQPGDATRVLGFKEIRHAPFYMTDDDFTAYGDFLLDAFPGARIVFNSRDADAVSRSGWLSRQNPDQVKRNVAACDRRFAAFAATHPDSCLHLRYEDYVADHGIARTLYDFIDLPYDPQAVEAVFSKPLDHATKYSPKKQG